MSPTLVPYVEAASTMAIVASSYEPLVFLDDQLRIIAVSASFCVAFHIDPAGVTGRQLSEIGSGEWAAPQLVSLLKATASGFATVESYELDLAGPGKRPRHLVLNAHRLEDGDKEHLRLLLAVSDVTEARAAAQQKDDLVREKAILLREVQHRVANSLQIIASVLMQSARQVQSLEARGHLQNAHHRVMSIAAVQRQLAASSLGDVLLGPYFRQLCESLGASMIHDPEQLSIKVTVDDSSVPADTSVGLGLIVTELVINALKHAFPGRRHGLISVDYLSIGTGWRLSVADNGIGIATGENAPKPGLGSGIVEALARQLGAEIVTTDTAPGTSVAIVRDVGATDGADTAAAA